MDRGNSGLIASRTRFVIGINGRGTRITEFMEDM
jgi:hypothetical protein